MSSLKFCFAGKELRGTWKIMRPSILTFLDCFYPGYNMYRLYMLLFFFQRLKILLNKINGNVLIHESIIKIIPWSLFFCHLLFLCESTVRFVTYIQGVSTGEAENYTTAMKKFLCMQVGKWFWVSSYSVIYFPIIYPTYVKVKYAL
jgi:hypothetical protein